MEVTMRKQIFYGSIITLVLLFSISNRLAALQHQSGTAGAPQTEPKQQNQPGTQSGQRPGMTPGTRAFGTIGPVGVDRLELKKMDGTAQTVMVDDQTRYVEGAGRSEATRA